MAVGGSDRKMTTSPNKTDALLARITILETHVTHQDQIIEELSAVLTQHWENINEVASKLQQLTLKMKKLDGDFG